MRALGTKGITPFKVSAWKERKGTLTGTSTGTSTWLSILLVITFHLLALGSTTDLVAKNNDDLAWPAWRGAAFDGVAKSTHGTGPIEFDANQHTWKVALPGRGSSTPIVVNQRIFVTAPVEDQDALLCFDFAGNLTWQIELGKQKPGKHRNGSGSNPSPISDGNLVYAYFKSGTLAAVDMDGELVWRTNLTDRFGPENLFWDAGTSPALTQQHVIIARMHQGESWVAAFNKSNGEIAWRVDRNFPTPVEGDNGYTTPLVIDYEGRESILIWGAERVTIHDAMNGEVVLTCGGFNPDETAFWPQVASPVLVEDIAIIPYGRADQGNPRLFGIRLFGKGDVTDKNHLWKRTDIGSFVPTPAVRNGRLFVLGDRGELECLDPESGRTLAKRDLPRSRANFYASPVWIGDRLYVAREDGNVFVLDWASRQFQLKAENQMGESIIGSLVPIPEGLLIRGENHLFFVANQTE